MKVIVVGIVEWESAAALDNLVYRGVSFAEAATVIGTTNEVYFQHRSEKRVVGPSIRGKILALAYKWVTVSAGGERAHLLRAWLASPDEKRRLRQ